jgi:hypothetical protein
MAMTNGTTNTDDKRTSAAAKKRASRPAKKSRNTAASKRRSTASSKSSSRRSSSLLDGRTTAKSAAVKLLGKGRSVLGSAYNWADETSRSLPRTARNIHMPSMPSTRSMENMIKDKPLMMGAVGLGIGVLLGAMLPSYRSVTGSSSRSSGRRH